MNNSSFDLHSLTPHQKQLRLQILELCYRQKYWHLGSCLTAIDGIDAVYQIKKPDDIFVLSNGHAGIALYIVLKNLGLISETEINTLYIHPDRNPKLGIEVSTGSLGQGLPITVGLAIAQPDYQIFCMISDGECAEGSIWESLRFIADHELTNLVILLNANGWGAYDRVAPEQLITRIASFGFDLRECDGHQSDHILHRLTQPITRPTVVVLHTINNQLPFLSALDAHYYAMTESDWTLAQELLQ